MPSSTLETLTLTPGAHDFCVFIPINIGSSDYRERGNPVLTGRPSTKSEGDPASLAIEPDPTRGAVDLAKRCNGGHSGEMEAKRPDVERGRDLPITHRAGGISHRGSAARPSILISRPPVR